MRHTDRLRQSTDWRFRTLDRSAQIYREVPQTLGGATSWHNIEGRHVQHLGDMREARAAGEEHDPRARVASSRVVAPVSPRVRDPRQQSHLEQCPSRPSGRRGGHQTIDIPIEDWAENSDVGLRGRIDRVVARGPVLP